MQTKKWYRSAIRFRGPWTKKIRFIDALHLPWYAAISFKVRKLIFSFFFKSLTVQYKQGIRAKYQLSFLRCQLSQQLFSVKWAKLRLMKKMQISRCYNHKQKIRAFNVPWLFCIIYLSISDQAIKITSLLRSWTNISILVNSEILCAVLFLKNGSFLEMWPGMVYFISNCQGAVFCLFAKDWFT